MEMNCAAWSGSQQQKMEAKEVEGARDVFQIEMKWKYPVRGAIG